MHKIQKVDYASLPNARFLDNGTYVFRLCDVNPIMSRCKDEGWIVLGGDILTVEYEYTYDSWFYSPDRSISLQSNVSLSIAKCEDYLMSYSRTHGNSFLCALVLSDKYLGG